jgi:hypothetical protein
VDNTQAVQAPTPGVRQERQLVAGRYRLASFHRGDETTEVWRALDETAKQVVTLEFLRDREPTAKERFLAAGRRMASIDRPSVMRVAAVHDDHDETFIVFEHLVHVPVPLDWLKPVDEPAAPILKPAAPPSVEEPKAPPVLATAQKTILATAAPEDPTAEITSEAPSDRGLAGLIHALRAREMALLDTALVREAALEIWAEVRAALEDVRLETTTAQARALLDRAVEEGRALFERADMAMLKSWLASASAAAQRLSTIRPPVRVPTPRVSRAPHIRKRTPVVAAVPKAPRAPRAPIRLGIHVRWSRVLSRGLLLGIIAAAAIALPPELVRNIGNEVGSIGNEVGSTIGSTIEQTIGQRLGGGAPAASELRAATWDVPPLSAYHAAFAAQAPYPTARPNETVEWVVALRNTGSVGWYRGIEGAQASLALADGTSAGVQSTAYVGPGQVGWFVVHFRAPSELGAHTVSFVPRIDGRGSLPDMGIYAIVTVSANP